MHHPELIAALFPTVPEDRLQEAEDRLREYLALVVGLVDKRLAWTSVESPPLTAAIDDRTLGPGRTFTSEYQDTPT